MILFSVFQSPFNQVTKRERSIFSKNIYLFSSFEAVASAISASKAEKYHGINSTGHIREE